MATHSYKDALQMAESLSPDEQRRLLAELEAHLAKSAPSEKKHSIMELSWSRQRCLEGN